MGCCNDPSVALTPSAQNPALHVNYAKGMVLGVDDLTQEFTYLSGRDRWAVAELIGYGTTSGLAVTVEDTSNGPRVRVARGAAAAPSGRMICVPQDQCGVINQWLAKPDNAQKINLLLSGSPPLSPPASPPGALTISLYLTLCYADCLTAPVPIPGEPCRSDDQLMAPSRIADDYKLDFRTAAPPQTEEDAIQDFVAWLRQVPIVYTSPPSSGDEQAWMAALKAAAQPWFTAMSASPPLSPPASPQTLGDFMFGSPPPSLAIGPDQLGHFLRVAFRFWVETLRPLWMTRVCGAASKPDDDCVLLAGLQVPIVWVGGSPSGVWQVAGNAASIAIDERRRPYLAHQRLLQEWIWFGLDAGAPSSSPTFFQLAETGAERLAFLETNQQNLTLDQNHHVVVCTRNANQKITLPGCAPANQGREYIVRSAVSQTTLVCTGTDLISITDGSNQAQIVINQGKAVTVISNGQNRWHVTAAIT
jgi:hypothetical protein